MRQDDTAGSLRIVEPMMRDMRAAPPPNVFQALILCNIASLSLVYANDFERARSGAAATALCAGSSRPM